MAEEKDPDLTAVIDWHHHPTVGNATLDQTVESCPRVLDIRRHAEALLPRLVAFGRDSPLSILQHD